MIPRVRVSPLLLIYIGQRKSYTSYTLKPRLRHEQNTRRPLCRRVEFDVAVGPSTVHSQYRNTRLAPSVAATPTLRFVPADGGTEKQRHDIRAQHKTTHRVSFSFLFVFFSFPARSAAAVKAGETVVAHTHTHRRSLKPARASVDTIFTIRTALGITGLCGTSYLRVPSSELRVESTRADLTES